MSLDTLKTNLVNFGQSAYDVIEPYAENFKTLVNETVYQPLVDTNVPHDKGRQAVISHYAQESLKFLAKVIVVGAALYTVSLAFSGLNILACIAVATGVFTLATNKELMDKLATKLNQYWTPAVKGAVIPATAQDETCAPVVETVSLGQEVKPALVA